MAEPGIRDRMATERFEFEFDQRVRPAAAMFAALPHTTWLELRDDELEIRFGLWRLVTPRENITGAEITGPYRWLKIAGPPHLSFTDRGITFGTSTERGVCIRFARPVPMRPPYWPLQHPAATVTVQRPSALVSLLTR